MSMPERTPPSSSTSVLPRHRLDDSRQRGDGRRRAIELPAAMVGDDDAVRIPMSHAAAASSGSSTPLMISRPFQC